MRKPPKWVNEVCAGFGSDPMYGQQKYRVIWGPDREEIRFGKLEKRYDDVDPRWILEVFVPHGVYGPWDEEAMGPKPPGGEYFISQTIEVEGQPISMTNYGRELLKLLILCVEKGKAMSEWQRRRFRDDKTEKKKKAESQRFSDIYDDAMGPFGENAIAGIPGKRNSADMKLVEMSSLSPELQSRLATRAGQIKQL